MPFTKAAAHDKRSTKTTQVAKLLKDEGLRQSVEASWQRERAQTAPTDLLSRCKALNAFALVRGGVGECEKLRAAAVGCSTDTSVCSHITESMCCVCPSIAPGASSRGGR